MLKIDLHVAVLLFQQRLQISFALLALLLAQILLAHALPNRGRCNATRGEQLVRAAHALASERLPKFELAAARMEIFADELILS